MLRAFQNVELRVMSGPPKQYQINPQNYAKIPKIDSLFAGGLNYKGCLPFYPSVGLEPTDG